MNPLPSIERRLAVRLAILAVVVLSLTGAAIHAAAALLHERAQERLLAIKVNKLAETSQGLRRPGDDRFAALLRANADRRPGTRLALWRADGSVYYADADDEAHRLSDHVRARDFVLDGPSSGEALRGRFAIDVEADARMLGTLGWIVVAAVLGGGLAAGLLGMLAVRRGLRPIRALSAQTATLVPGQRLRLDRPVAELAPWVAAFNALMDRVEAARARLESFNAHVAHELRTPLTALVGKTEVALMRPRPADALVETLAANLEELTRMSALVNDMLFLARADHGAADLRCATGELRALVEQVGEFHDAERAERGLAFAVDGHARCRFDEALVQRAVSNLLGNAARHARSASAIRVVIAEGDERVDVAVENEGDPVDAGHLPHLFDRFYRADPARPDRASHHGLGLAIVDAIARMHGGGVFATSADGVTRIGFWLPVSAPVQRRSFSTSGLTTLVGSPAT